MGSAASKTRARCWRSSPIGSPKPTASYAAGFAELRCLVPATYYVEWSGECTPKPMYCSNLCDAEISCVAGIRGPAETADGPVESYSITPRRPAKMRSSITTGNRPSCGRSGPLCPPRRPCGNDRHALARRVDLGLAHRTGEGWVSLTDDQATEAFRQTPVAPGRAQEP